MQSKQQICQNTIKRLLKDIKDIKKNKLQNNGIYYHHSDTEILKGYALIIGPDDTPYQNGYYLFDITYPYNYPHAPPKFKFCTSDGYTRFNPNLYVEGKVCLSILNTWSGEQWSACQSISTILLTLCTILHNKPLLNEPGFTENHYDFENYNKIITFKNFDFAICHTIEEKSILNKFPFFKDIIYNNFKDNYDKITADLFNKSIDNICIQTSVYGMKVFINYNKIFKRLENIYSSLKN